MQRITGTLREDICTFMAIILSIPLRMRHILGKVCRENENTRFIFNNLIPKMVKFMR
jgi:hypothetical protein